MLHGDRSMHPIGAEAVNGHGVIGGFLAIVTPPMPHILDGVCDDIDIRRDGSHLPDGKLAGDAIPARMGSRGVMHRSAVNVEVLSLRERGDLLPR